MFCAKCGKENKENAIFCKGCGEELSVVKNTRMNVEYRYDEIDTDGDKKNKQDEKNNIRKGVLICGILIALIIFFVVLASFLNRGIPNITEKEVISCLNQFGYNQYSIKDEVYYAEINSLQDFRYAWDSKENKMTISSGIKMSSDDIDMKGEVYAIFLKNNKAWDIEYCELKIQEMYPKKGVAIKTESELWGVVQSLYTDIEWGYVYEGISDINYDFPIHVADIERDTNLDEKTDSITYSYNFETYTASFSGTFREHYEFIDGWGWTYLYTDSVLSEVDWNLEGKWELDIYTYYVDLQIEEMDWEENMAVIKAKGNVFQGMGNSETYYIPFVENADGIYFTTFFLDKEITLIARYNDMYYMIPSIFNNQDPVEKAAGGKK